MLKKLGFLSIGFALAASCSTASDKSEPLAVEKGRLASTSVEPPLDGGVVSPCYPQAVQLRRGGDHSCTGVVIGPDLVMTSGHCLAYNGAYSGAPDVRAVGLDGGGPDFTVTQVYMHPDYNGCQPPGVTFANASGRDLAVLKVDRNLGIPPVTLGSASDLPTNGGRVHLMGLGLPNDGERRLGVFLRDESVPGAAGAGALGLRGEDAGTCPGDSGGPIFTYTPGCGTSCPGACSGSPAPVLVAVNSSQPLNEPRGLCGKPNNVAANVTDPTNLNWINQVKAGTAPTYNPQVLQNCCTAGTQQGCTGPGGCSGTQVCRSDKTWDPCVCPCVPETCMSLGKQCGSWPDGCNGSVSCPLCPLGQTCNNQSGQCECIPQTCESRGWTCGTHGNGCGGLMFCGICRTGWDCNTQGNCECTTDGELPPVECGPYTDKCGKSQNAGNCQLGQTCLNGRCCVHDSCASRGFECGTHGNGCGGLMFCGFCSAGWECNSQGRCDCVSDPVPPVQCGFYTDNCGRSRYAGDCMPPQFCENNVCRDPQGTGGAGGTGGMGGTGGSGGTGGGGCVECSDDSECDSDYCMSNGCCW